MCVRRSSFFFFSSRRRHTRLQGDWSSDVCSSDLPQQAITRSLIDEIVPQQLPESVAVRVNALAAQLAPGQQGRLLRLSYAGESAYQPILSHLIRELGLDLSILHGQIDEIQEQTFGSLAVFASGDAAKIDAAVDHLRATGVQVQIVSTRD